MNESQRQGLKEFWEKSRQRWPDVELDLDTYVAHAIRHLEAGSDPEAASRRLHGEDLFLACACANGNGRAIRIFEDEILPQVNGALRRLDPSPAFADEVRQLVRQKLFVDPNKAAKIADYAGRGPLATWVRVSAVRTALNLRNQDARETPMALDHVADLAPVGGDPAMDYLKTRFADDFQRALRAACEGLEGRQRTLLRLRFVDGLSIDQIGGVYGVHRATAARWLSRIREEIFDATRSGLQTSLQIDTGEFDSLLRLVRSQLDVSVSQVLRTTDGTSEP